MLKSYYYTSNHVIFDYNSIIAIHVLLAGIAPMIRSIPTTPGKTITNFSKIPQLSIIYYTVNI